MNEPLSWRMAQRKTNRVKEQEDSTMPLIFRTPLPVGQQGLTYSRGVKARLWLTYLDHLRVVSDSVPRGSTFTYENELVVSRLLAE
jgi:hypothetical protein